MVAMKPLALDRLQRSSSTGTDWTHSPRGDPKLVPMEMLVKFVDLAESGTDVAAAVELGRRILNLEPSNKLVNDHMPALQMRLKLAADESSDSDEEE